MTTDLKTFSFGAVIAFVAPGFLALKAVSYRLTGAGQWLSAAESSDQSIGLFLFILVASLALGIIISGLRALVIDHALEAGWLGMTPIRRVGPDYSRMADPAYLAAFQAIVENHYRYYQFYANTFVALFLLLLFHATSPEKTEWRGIYVLYGATLVILLLSSRNALTKHCEAVGKLSAKETKSP